MVSDSVFVVINGLSVKLNLSSFMIKSLDVY